MKAHLRKVSLSAKKANVVAGLVRGKSVVEALDILRFTPKKAAKHLEKAVSSAAANAEHNDEAKREDLVIKSIVINRAEYWRRYLPSTRGRALPLRKPHCHISVELAKVEAPEPKAKKPAPKKTAKTS